MYIMNGGSSYDILSDCTIETMCKFIMRNFIFDVHKIKINRKERSVVQRWYRFLLLTMLMLSKQTANTQKKEE